MRFGAQWRRPLFSASLLLGALWLIGPLIAEGRADGRANYQACLNEVQKNPANGLARAQKWRREGGGAAANHCAALALFALNRFAEAAATLEHLARQLAPRGPVERADVWAQAANAWLLAGHADKAEVAIEKAIQRFPGDPDILIDRARVRAAEKNYRGALKDLDRVVLLGSDGPLVQAFRAAALRHLGRLEAALKAAEKALKLEPASLEGRLERDLVHWADGNQKSARQDLEFLVKNRPNSVAGKTAAAHLAQLQKPRGKIKPPK